MFLELQKRSIEKKNEVYSDPSSTDEEKQIADYCYEIYSNEDNVKALSKRDILATFVLLGVYDGSAYEKNNQRYNALMLEINKQYTLIQPHSLLKRESK